MQYDKQFAEGRIKLRLNWFFDRIMPLKVAHMGKSSQRWINAET